jgi:hypothetical protein
MKFIIFICISLLFASCFSIKPQVTKTGSNLWEDFYVSPGVMQYFIKPLSFNNKEQNLDIDFTFRNVSDSVTVNFSVYSNQENNKPDSLIISNELTTISICCPKTLVSEYVNKKHKLRQTGKLSLNELKALTKNNDWTITIQQGNLKDQYFTTQKTKNNIEKIEKNLMIQANQ